MVRRIYAVSDLHIGAAYSGWQRDLPRVEAGMRAADESVLCGDVFEGTMMQMPLEARITLAREGLGRLAAANPHGILHVLFGNHEEPLIRGGTPESAPYLEVAKAVREAAKALPNVRIHDKGWLQLGDIVFTHGHRELKLEEPEPSRLRQAADMLPNIALPGYSSSAWIYPTRGVTRRIFDAVKQEKLEGPVRHIVFGHTHAPLKAYPLHGCTLGAEEDVQMHNLGASIAYRPSVLQPLLFEQDDDGTTRSVRHPPSVRGR